MTKPFEVTLWSDKEVDDYISYVKTHDAELWDRYYEEEINFGHNKGIREEISVEMFNLARSFCRGKPNTAHPPTLFYALRYRIGMSKE